MTDGDKKSNEGFFMETDVGFILMIEFDHFS